MNNRRTRKLQNGSVQEIKWNEVRVGDILCIHDKEEIPADVVSVLPDVVDSV